jgi:uncharacterized protein (TIGR00304 family)
VVSGEVETGFIVVFPFLIGSGLYAFLGFIFFILAFLCFVGGFSYTSVSDGVYEEEGYGEVYPKKKVSVKGGGVVFVGPIPIVFGSSWKIALVLMLIVLGIILVMVFVVGVF